MFLIPEMYKIQYESSKLVIFELQDWQLKQTLKKVKQLLKFFQDL